MLYFIYKTKSNVSYHIKGAQQLFERRLPTRRLPAAAHQKAAAVVRGGYRQRCCGGSPCAVPARQPATHRMVRCFAIRCGGVGLRCCTRRDRMVRCFAIRSRGLGLRCCVRREPTVRCLDTLSRGLGLRLCAQQE